MTSCKTNSSSTLFFPDLSHLDKSNVPHHVAIIPDGNRRWAKCNLREVGEGYLQGAETLITTINAAKELGIKVLTVFTFSTENWNRPKHEVDAILQTLEIYLTDYQEQLIELSIRFNIIGSIEHLPASLFQVISQTIDRTKECTEFDLILAVNYGGRNEIYRAVKKIVDDCVSQKIVPQALTEELIANYLDTSRWPDPDLIIRTSGERRISNFLLWQSSYTEIYIEEANWPNFTPQHLLTAVCDYQNRERRRGGGTT